MRHEPLARSKSKRSLVTRRRFQVAGALVVGALLPYLTRGLIGDLLADPPGVNAFYGNAVAVLLAVWMRLSLEIYPGIRRSYVIFPAALAGHGIVVAFLLMSRLPYDRGALVAGFVLHVLWNYAVYMLA